MVRRIFVLALVFALLADRSRAQDVALESRPARWRLTYDSFDESSSKNLGLVGIHFDLLSPFDEAPGVYTGLGGYAAVIGTSGGLFVGGATVGYLREIYDGYSLDFGLFAGGGGGGDADVGSGLMLRPHVGLEYALGLYAVRIELARVDFPDGDIDDTFISIGVGLPTEILTAAPGRRAGRIPDEAVIRRPLRVTPTVMHLDPDSGQKLKNGAPLDDEIQLMGIELDYFLNRSLYGAVEAYGAGGGGVAGFAMGLIGLGLSKPLLGNLATLELKVSAGAGGGGEVDTGGGFLWQATGGVNARINDTLGLQIMVGRLLAPDGDFDSTAFQAGISWSSMPAELRLDYPRSRLSKEGLSSDAVQLDTTRLQLLHKTYLPKSSAKKSDG
ncbi:MAG: hypothetical protein O7B99_07435, partial [Planctomycetota bacterium]|nr:hypothetical protein [Planctomycetota bacterium]